MRRLVINGLTIIAMSLVGYLLVKEMAADAPPGKDKNRTLTVGWEAHYPYQYEAGDGGFSQPSGLSTELVREAFRRAGYQVDFVVMDWPTSLKRVREGSLDASCMAFWSQSRKEFSYFSQPFLTTRCALFSRKGEVPNLPETVVGLRDLLVSQQLSIGYARQHAYLPEILAMLEDPLVHSKDSLHDDISLNGLLEGSTDFVLADQLGGTSTVLKNGWKDKIECTLLEIDTQEAGLIFSRKSVSPEVVSEFNQALSSMTTDGTHSQIVRTYYYPTMIGILAQDLWFDELSLLAVGAAAISGIFLARKVGTNLVGAFLLAACPAAGGGLLRDLVAGRRPVAIIEDPSILLLVVFLVLLAFLVFRILDYRAPALSLSLDSIDIDRQPALVFFDALGLAAFTVVGVLVAMKWRCEPLWLWGPLLAALTNGGGSALRDVLLRREVSIANSTLPYLEVSICWGFLFSSYLTYNSLHLIYSMEQLQIAIVVTLLGVCLSYLVLRLSGLRSPTYGVVRPHQTSANQPN